MQRAFPESGHLYYHRPQTIIHLGARWSGPTDTPNFADATAAPNVSIKTKWRGLTADDVTVEVDLQGNDAGMSYSQTIAANGVGTPEVTPTLQMMGEQWFTAICNEGCCTTWNKTAGHMAGCITLHELCCLTAYTAYLLPRYRTLVTGIRRINLKLLEIR